MKNVMVEVIKDEKGLRLVAIGQPDLHFMDWQGTNFHFVSLPGWKRGRRLEDTERNREILWALAAAVSTDRVEEKVKGKTGQFFSETSPDYELVCKSLIDI